MKYLVSTLFILVCSQRSFAGSIYSFADCIEVLKKNNAELQAAQENLQSAQSLVNATYGAYLPQISANLNYTRGQSDVNNNEGYNATLNASENLFNGFADSAKMSDAKGKLVVAEANLKSIKAKLSYDLKSAFANVLYAQDSIKLAQNILKRRTDNLNLVQLRFQSGRENKGSVLLSKAYMKQAQLDVLKAEHALDSSKSTLIRVLGLAPDEVIDVKERVPVLDAATATPAFQKIAEDSPERRTSEGQLQSAEAGLTSSRSGFYPTLNLQGSVGKYGEDFFPDQDKWSVGATLSWSLFSGGKDYFTQKSSFAQKLVAENNLRNLNLDLIARLKAAYANYVESVKDVEVSDAFADASSTRAEIARSKYNNGLSSFDDWDIIENDLINRQKDQTLKHRDRIVAEATWEKTQGVGVLP